MMNTEFKITGGNECAEYALQRTEKDGVFFLDVSMKLPQAEIPAQFTLGWEMSGVDCCSLWNPRQRVHTIDPDWAMSKCNSRLASNMPIEQVVSFSDKNRILVAVSDVDNPIRIDIGYSEETANVVCRIHFFTLPTNEKTSYKATVRLDTREIDFYDSIYDCTAWWENECGYESAFVPEHARLPMDSLWYSFHQELETDKIIKECALSKSLGMESVIIDDGWQTDDNNRGYAYCGDWEVCEKKIPDMAKLAEEIHKIGMKVILWYSVPFVGMYSKKYDEFKDYFLDGAGNAGTSFALDPRYKKVRDFLADTYEKAVKEWNLDGLKLDFIDSFRLQGKSLEFDSKRDFQSLEEALHALLSEIRERLTAINPDILIEFRQSYVGPSIRKYGNMLRVGDCPGDIAANRGQIINLRMTSGKTAVHSDMIMWHEKDSAENAALQFASIIFSVPQISMLIDTLPEDHIKMLRHYISFWKEHREVLIDGKLTSQGVKSDYTQATSFLKNKSITAVYTNPLVELKTADSIIVNASTLNEIVVKADSKFTYKTVNCMGDTVDRGEKSNGVSLLSVPTGGMIFIES